MTDTLLFRRKIRVVVDTIEITDLHMTVQVKKSLKPEPNTAELKIWNLNPDHRSYLEQRKTSTVLIEMGYVDGISTIFLGDLRNATSVDEGPDIVTSLTSGDGEKAIRSARINVSLKKDTKPDQVLRSVAESLGVNQGNLDQAIAQFTGQGIRNHFTQGTVITGSAYREMTNICKSFGLTWSVQNGALQILALRQTLENSAVRLAADTGLIGSPTVNKDGVVSAKMLLAPDVFPGRKLVLESARLKGQYRIESCQYTGDTAGNDWYIDLQGKRY
jgi:hypothetical protein